MKIKQPKKPKTNKQFNKEKINKKHTKMTNIQLLKGDCIKKLKGLKDNSVDSVVTDPPYEIGFMGKGWDDSGIANNPKLWKEVLRVLKPGGHLLSFSHSRTYHRQAVAVEDAGFEIRDQIMWVYGSGFPKSHNIGKAVEKLNGDVKVIGKKKGAGSTGRVFVSGNEEYIGGNKGVFKKEYDDIEINNQYEGWGTALKPAHEPIVMARKPFKGSVAQNVLEYGTGGINIDECRIGTEGGTTRSGQSDKVTETGKLTNSKSTNSLYRTGHDIVELNEGRFPANIIFDEEAGKILDEQSGVSKSLGGTGKISLDSSVNLGGGNTYFNYGDTGGASRFFYCPKASKKDRNDGCNELEEKASTKQFNSGMEGKVRSNGSVIKDPIKQHNSHPTVKPTDLMSYLVRLVTPKGGVVLDPFMGSGSTGKASVREGMDFIGIEREDEYMEIAKSRIEHEQSKHNYRKFFDAV